MDEMTHTTNVLCNDPDHDEPFACHCQAEGGYMCEWFARSILKSGEKLCLAIAIRQLQRGEIVTPNIAEVCIVALARITQTEGLEINLGGNGEHPEHE